MKLSKLIGERFKERPADCLIDSHALMLRGGYIKHVANGIFSLTPLMRRITKKIEAIIREEMDAVDGQEVLFPVVLPGSLWEESGRYANVGSELIRFNDRNGSSLVLGMTHEEAAVQLVKSYGNSYTKYPFMFYQLQTKFRDEARPRGGLIRTREFTMKDAYSFHISQEDLSQYYERCYHAYERIFARVGLPDVIPVQSDSGMMGGAISHEYIFLTPVGEDSIALCSQCGYRANMEAAECITDRVNAGPAQELQRVFTPDIHTIEDVCRFLNMPPEQSCKAVVYQKNTDNEYVVLFIRGDCDVNETKLTNLLQDEIRPAVITEDCSLIAGYIGPYNLPGQYTVLYDSSLQYAASLSCGANAAQHHYTGLNMARDLGHVEYHDLAKIKDGGQCPNCGKHTISISHGIEVGNIFQLGSKYTEAMGMQYHDQDGHLQYPLMGCYGIGVERLAASVCEAHHDEYGPLWPMPVAPWQVHICAVHADNSEVKSCADSLYRELRRRNIEVMYDDRAVSTGVMFSDADLIGIPIRVIVSPRNIRESCCEIISRDKKIQIKAPVAEAANTVQAMIHDSML